MILVDNEAVRATGWYFNCIPSPGRGRGSPKDERKSRIETKEAFHSASQGSRYHRSIRTEDRLFLICYTLDRPRQCVALSSVSFLLCLLLSVEDWLSFFCWFVEMSRIKTRGGSLQVTWTIRVWRLCWWKNVFTWKIKSIEYNTDI